MSYYDLAAKCPYYLDTRELSISCEGLMGGFKHMLRFTKKADKENFFEKYCACFGYGKCPYCAAQELRFEKAAK